jgi:formate hydrogenlyase transcriptional activator
MWGATAKVEDLDRRYADLLRAAPGAGPAADMLHGALDTVTVTRAAQAISRELDIDRLLERLLHVALENAGGERGVFLLESDGELVVRVEGNAERVETHGAAPASAHSDRVPVSVVNFVRHSGDSVVLADAPLDDRFGEDLYVVRERPLSLLATPVLNQGRLMGVLYLENRLAADAFTPARVQVLQILCAQAAIAIENARLFAEVNRLRDKLQAENVYLAEEISAQHDFAQIIGTSPALTKVLALVQRVAPTESTVLITGETGTGKELIARAIHDRSTRRERPLVSINCGAISPSLVESELFGHEKGAFTGAIGRKIGRFELADGGTLFLDEIGDLPLDLQVKLLRVLQEGEFERVGGTRGLKVNVRVIAATHQNLQEAVAAGRFRADLFYRLNVFPIQMPALRDRKEDIPLLAHHLVKKYAARLGRQIDTIPAQALEALTTYSWPGNIRELGNIIERSVIVSRDHTLQLADWVTGQYRPVATPAKAIAGGTQLLEVERAHICRTLEATGWKVSGAGGAAEALGLKPTTLEARMKKLGITRPGR